MLDYVKYVAEEPVHMQLWHLYQSRGSCLQQVSAFCSVACDVLIIAEANSWDANIRVRVPYFSVPYCAYISNSFFDLSLSRTASCTRFSFFFKFHC